MPNAKIQKRFQKKEENAITIGGIKLTYIPATVGDATIIVDSPMLYTQDLSQKVLMNEQTAEETLHHLENCNKHYRAVVKELVIAVDDEPTKLDDADLDALGPHNLAKIHGAITGEESIDHQAVRQFRKKNK